jgi:hypothetical protein
MRRCRVCLGANINSIVEQTSLATVAQDWLQNFWNGYLMPCPMVLHLQVFNVIHQRMAAFEILRAPQKSLRKICNLNEKLLNQNLKFFSKFWETLCLQHAEYPGLERLYSKIWK